MLTAKHASAVTLLVAIATVAWALKRLHKVSQVAVAKRTTIFGFGTFLRPRLRVRVTTRGAASD